MGALYGILALAIASILWNMYLYKCVREDEETIIELTCDLDEANERINRLHEEVQRWTSNYGHMRYKKQKLAEFMGLCINFKEGDGEKIDAFLKEELTEHTYNKITKSK